MKLELHILQNFAPSNLNRDDTGAPKDCEFGGVRRARISSQCLKRAVRVAFQANGHFNQGQLAARTKRLVEQIADELTTGFKKDPEASAKIARIAIEGAGFGIKDDQKTQYLLFIPRRVIGALAGVLNEHWDEVSKLAGGKTGPAGGDAEGKESKAKQKKREAQAAFPKEIGAAIREILGDATRTPDLALFGRMIADEPQWNADAACQVAHAISTNRVNMDFDFYTAVDDFRPEDNQGSDMMGTVQFNSSCFYRYSVLDLNQLASNLGAGDPEILRKTVEGYLRASIEAIPTGKQNSMAAQNPPSYILAVVRSKGVPVSLANAFVRPIRPESASDLIQGSVCALEEYFARVSRLYGDDSTPVRAFSCADRDTGRMTPGIDSMESVGNLVSGVLQVVAGE